MRRPFDQRRVGGRTTPGGKLAGANDWDDVGQRHDANRHANGKTVEQETAGEETLSSYGIRTVRESS